MLNMHHEHFRVSNSPKKYWKELLKIQRFHNVIFKKILFLICFEILILTFVSHHLHKFSLKIQGQKTLIKKKYNLLQPILI